MRLWGHEPWRGGEGGKGTKPAKEERSMGPGVGQGAWHGTVGLWGHESWAGKAGRAEGASMHWGPFMGP